MEYEDLISIATPEGLELTFALAGLGSRVIATLLDLLVRLAVFLVVLLLAVLIGGNTSSGGVIVVVAVLFALLYLYDVLFEAYASGQTPGKRWTSLRVLHLDGRPVGLGTAAVRNIVRVIDGPHLLYLPSVASVLATRHNQRLGDLAAGTIVVREPRAEKAPPAVVTPAGSPATPLSWLPPWDVTAISADEMIAVRAFLERRGQLPSQTRAELAGRLAATLGPKVPAAGAGAADPERFLDIVAALKSARHR